MRDQRRTGGFPIAGQNINYAGWEADPFENKGLDGNTVSDEGVMGQSRGFAARPQRSQAVPLRAQSRAEERAMIERALAMNGGDRDAVCRQLGVSRTTLWRRLRSSSAADIDL